MANWYKSFIVGFLLLFATSGYAGTLVNPYILKAASGYTISLVGQDAESATASGHTVTTTTGVSLQIGDIIIVSSWKSGVFDTLSGVTDDLSTPTTYTIRSELAVSTVYDLNFAYGVATKAGTAKVTATYGTTDQNALREIIVSVFRPSSGTWTLDVNGADTAAYGDTYDTATATTTAQTGDNELVIAVMGGQGIPTLSTFTIGGDTATKLTPDYGSLNCGYLIRSGGESGMSANATLAASTWVGGEFISFKLR